MLQKSPGKSTLFFLLVCLLSLGIGVWLGYGIRTQGLLGTAATIDAESSGSDSQNNTRDSSDVLGGARYIYGNEIFLFCKNCSKPMLAVRCLISGSTNLITDTLMK